MGKNAKLEITLWLSALSVLTLGLGGAIYHRLTAANHDSPDAQAQFAQSHEAHGAAAKNGLAPATVDPPTVVKVSPETTPDFLASTAGDGFRAKLPRHGQDGVESRSARDSASIMPVQDPAHDDPLAADTISQPASSQPVVKQSVIATRHPPAAMDVLAPENQQSPSIATAPGNADETSAPERSVLPLGPQSNSMPGTRVMLKTIPDDQQFQEPAPLPVVDARPIRRDSAVQQAADNVPGMDPPPAGSVPWQRGEFDPRTPVVAGPASLPPPPPRSDATSLPPTAAGEFPPAYQDPSHLPPRARIAAEPQYPPANESRPHYQPPATLPGALPPAGVSSAESGTAAVTRKDDKYVVQPNDNWWTITQRVYGNGAFYKALHEYNRRDYAQADLAVGDVIRTPELAVLQKNYPDLTPKSRKPAAVAGTHMANVSAKLRPGTRSYTVRQGDTMFDIARFQLGKASRWTEIYELNRDSLSEDFNFVRPGTVLLLPADEARGDRPDTTARTPSGQIQR